MSNSRISVRLLQIVIVTQMRYDLIDGLGRQEI